MNKPLLLFLSALLALTISAAQEPKFVLVGGGTTSDAMVMRFIELAGGPKAEILVVALTREEPNSAGESSAELLRENGAMQVNVLPYPLPTDLERRFERATGIYIPGGDQNRLMKLLGEKRAREMFQKAARRGAAFFGTSAGAMLMSDEMISGYGQTRGSAEIGTGLGLLPILIDTHFVERSRQERLAHAISLTRAKQAIGLERNEWVVITGTRLTEVHGKPYLYGIEPPRGSGSGRNGSR
ncbi:MAG: cyanophycinase [Fimbriimonadaceae bacterium]